MFVESFNSDLRSANGPAQDSLHQIRKLNKRFHRLGKGKLKYVSEIADSKASFEGASSKKIEKNKVHLTYIHSTFYNLHITSTCNYDYRLTAIMSRQFLNLPTGNLMKVFSKGM